MNQEYQEKTFNIFSFFNQIFMIFGIQVLVLVTVSLLLVEEGDAYGMIKLGNQGIANSTLLQFFLCAICMSSITSFFMTDLVLKRLRFLWRTIWMLSTVTLTIIIFIILFDWFPLNSTSGWMGFVVGYLICLGGSTLVMIIKTRLESKKYEKILSEYKKRNGEMNDE